MDLGTRPDKVRVGIIGCGSRGSYLARNCARLDSAKVTATSDVVLENAKRLAREFDACCFVDYRELLARRDVDAVIVAVPNSLHAEVVTEAANARKHVFCEKPMALSVAQCDRMIKAAKANQVKLMIGQSERYDPVFDKVKEIIDSGVIGEPFSIYLERIDTIDWLDSGRAWRAKAEASGGMLYHCNVHELDYMRYIAGDVDSVTALVSKNVAKGIEYEDTAHVLLHFKNGAIGTLLAGHCSALPGIGGKIHCTKGTIHFTRGQGITYKPFDRDMVNISVSHIQAEPADRRELREFVESVIEDRMPTIPGEEARKVIEVIQAAYLSAKKDRQIKLPLQFGPRPGN